MSVIGRLNCKNISANAKALLDAGNALREVAGSFTQVSESAEQLRRIAGMLADSIDYFKI